MRGALALTNQTWTFEASLIRERRRPLCRAPCAGLTARCAETMMMADPDYPRVGGRFLLWTDSE